METRSVAHARLLRLFTRVYLLDHARGLERLCKTLKHLPGFAKTALVLPEGRHADPWDLGKGVREEGNPGLVPTFSADSPACGLLGCSSFLASLCPRNEHTAMHAERPRVRWCLCWALGWRRGLGKACRKAQPLGGRTAIFASGNWATDRRDHAKHLGCGG